MILKGMGLLGVAAALIVLVSQIAVGENAALIAIYDSDPQHLWNRIYGQFYVRVTESGEVFGGDILDALLWYETQSLFINPTYQETLDLLDEFLTTDAENLITDPVKRAFFQRDLWAVFDWLALRTDTYVAEQDDYFAERRALQERIVQVMQRVALSETEIAALPDSYQMTINAKLFPTAYDDTQPSMPYLPAGIGQPDSAWVNIGYETGIAAVTHVLSETFSARSAFYVFYRLPDGRQATLDFIAALNAVKHGTPAPSLPAGTQVALVRQMLLIDDSGSITSSPIMGSIQLRIFSSPNLQQNFFQFNLSREQLFSGQAGLYAVAPDEIEFPMFMNHGLDPFENEDITLEQEQVTTLKFCDTCHFEPTLSSIISYSRDPFALPTGRRGERPILTKTTPDTQARLAIEWKQKQANWQALQAFWIGE